MTIWYCLHCGRATRSDGHPEACPVCNNTTFAEGSGHKAPPSDRWSIARSKVDEILAARMGGLDAESVTDARVENLRLVLEIERQRAADRQTIAQERAAAAIEASAKAINSMTGTAAELLAGLRNLSTAIEGAISAAEVAADQDQFDMFGEGPDGAGCACGKDHDAVG